MTIRSSEIYSAPHAGTGGYAVVAGPVPANEVWILKSARGFVSLAGVVAVAKLDGAGAVISVPCYAAPGAPGEQRFEDVWVVYEPGQQVGVFVPNGTIWYADLSGTKLVEP